MVRMLSRGGRKENVAILFLLLFASACVDSNGPHVLCKTAGWFECSPYTSYRDKLESAFTGYNTNKCVMCEVMKEAAATGSPFPLLARARGVAIRGYPFRVLSAKSLSPLDPSLVNGIGLIEAEITDVENNTFAGFSHLYQLSLDSNRLTKVKQTWFTGLENLLTLILSNNKITQIELGSFVHLTGLNVLHLKNNLLQVVNPSWLFGLKGKMAMNLGLNEINSISPGSFQHLLLDWLDLMGNDLSSLDGDVLGEQSSLLRFHVSSGMLASVHDGRPHGMMWSLHRMASWFRGSATMVVEVPKFLFCARYMAYELLFGWMFDSLSNVPGNIELGGVNPGRSCGDLDRFLSTISIQAPAVVLATDGSQADKLVPNTLEQCRQVWDYHGGITVTVGLVGSPIFRLVSMSTGNASYEGVAMTFVQTHNTNTLTTTETRRSQMHTTPTNDPNDDTKNITCILLTKDEHKVLSFTKPPVKCKTPTTTHFKTTYRSTNPPHYSEHTENDYTSSEPRDNSTLQVGTTPGSDMPTATDGVLISVVVSAVASLVIVLLVVLAWKVCAPKSNAGDEGAGDDAHIWTIPPGVAFPGLLRSASLPARPSKMASVDAVSCRSLPAVLDSIEPTYSEIPDDIATAQRPLPCLPHTYWEIPDDAISGVVRSASLPVVTCTLGGAPDDAASCRSLPAVLQSIEPTYSGIPDNIAAAQRPLPALPCTSCEIPDHEAAAQRPLPTRPHTYSEIPDDESGPMPFYGDAEFSLHVVRNRRQDRRAIRENGVTYGSAEQAKAQCSPLPAPPQTYSEIPDESGPMPFYADAADFSFHIVRNRGQNRLATRDSTTTSSRHRSGRSIATYGLAEQTKAQPNIFYKKATEVEGIRARRQLRTALVSQPADQGLRNDIDVTEVVLSRGQNGTEAHIAFLTSPPGYWPWDVSRDGTHNTPRRASLPHVSLPNTYWPWEIPGEGTHDTPRHASLPHVSLPNTYWPWEIPGEGTHDTPRRASLPHVTLPNTYWPWEIPVQGAHNISRRASLPRVTPPNTYWPWEMPGEGTHNTPRRAPLPHVTLPNTYWPWEIPGEGTHDTPRRASLPHVTMPNTYWPWELPGDGTHNTSRRASLPLVTMPNTYWPWQMPGEGTHNTPRRAPLPHVTLPNTYWPWEIPVQGAHNISRRASLPRVTPPNTYWPWEMPGEGTHNTPRREPLPLTLTNTYWPWEIPRSKLVTHHAVRPSNTSHCLTPTGHRTFQRREHFIPP
uniref:LRRCT domain-containing protein n=1 Tax=Branchiostoma floridae TaxID=7739 RepID=C3ZR23_BRAFL|eukprot:XP_002589053.1 hypothetical protein BRAFLDRAFT_87526 [Branchiostoma floridae]